MEETFCVVCDHIKRKLIDRAIDEHRSPASIAADFGLEELQVEVHRIRCGTDRSAPPVVMAEARRIVFDLARAAQQTSDQALALKALSLLPKLVVTEIKLSSKEPTRPRVKLTETEEWLELRKVLITSLSDYPDALRALQQALDDSER